MASSQGTPPSKINIREVTLVFIEAYRSLPELWDTENMADVACKQQTTALFISITVTHIRINTELTKKN